MGFADSSSQNLSNFHKNKRIRIEPKYKWFIILYIVVSLIISLMFQSIFEIYWLCLSNPLDPLNQFISPQSSLSLPLVLFITTFLSLLKSIIGLWISAKYIPLNLLKAGILQRKYSYYTIRFLLLLGNLPELMKCVLWQSFNFQDTSKQNIRKWLRKVGSYLLINWLFYSGLVFLEIIIANTYLSLIICFYLLHHIYAIYLHGYILYNSMLPPKLKKKCRVKVIKPKYEIKLLSYEQMIHNAEKRLNYERHHGVIEQI